MSARHPYPVAARTIWATNAKKLALNRTPGRPSRFEQRVVGGFGVGLKARRRNGSPSPWQIAIISRDDY
jgi:hypothetical protein